MILPAWTTQVTSYLRPPCPQVPTDPPRRLQRIEPRPGCQTFHTSKYRESALRKNKHSIMVFLRWRPSLASCSTAVGSAHKRTTRCWRLPIARAPARGGQFCRTRLAESVLHYPCWRLGRDQGLRRTPAHREACRTTTLARRAQSSVAPTPASQSPPSANRNAPQTRCPATSARAPN